MGLDGGVDVVEQPCRVRGWRRKLPDEEAGEDPKLDAVREAEKGTLTGLLKSATAAREATLGEGFEAPT